MPGLATVGNHLLRRCIDTRATVSRGSVGTAANDVLALAGPVLAARQALFDFVVEELSYREVEDARRRGARISSLVLESQL